jgi:hypothetical protein
MLSTVRKSRTHGRHRRPAVRNRRRGKIYWLNTVVLCLMASGVVMAFAGRHTFRWAPPPIPSTYAAANGAQGSAAPPVKANPRLGHLAVKPMAGSHSGQHQDSL